MNSDKIPYGDEELVKMIQADDESAFTDIYDRYWKELFISARKIVESRAIAQDAVQEVFISLWKRREDLGVTSLRPWLFQAVRFQVFKAIRHEKTNQRVLDNIAAISMDIAGSDPILFRELQETIRRIIAELPDDEQEYFRMNREQGMTYRQIAEKKG